MSNERLRVKLLSAGFDEEMVMGFARDDLIAYYAEMVANPQAAAVSPVGPAVDPELEKEKLAFERQN